MLYVSLPESPLTMFVVCLLIVIVSVLISVGYSTITLTDFLILPPKIVTVYVPLFSQVTTPSLDTFKRELEDV